MSLEPGFNANSSSMNMLDTFNIKNQNSFLNQTSISKKQKTYKTQASQFLKTSLTGMIKYQLKAFRLQKKLQKQMQEFKKTKEKKQLIADVHKIQKYRQQQSQLLKSRFDQYIKEKQRKNSIVEELNLKRKHNLQRKRQQNQRKLQLVRKKHNQRETQQVNNRLSRAQSIQSNRNTTMSKSKMSKSSRNIYSSLNHRQLIHSRIVDEEQKRVTTYLKKIKHAESRILEREVQNQQKKQKSIKTQVKNLIKERSLKQENMMKTFQEKFDTKMGSFYENLNRYHMEHSSLLMNKSIFKSQLRERVIKNKQNNASKLINKTMENFMRKNIDKQNLYSNYKQKMDFLRTKSSLMSSNIQAQKQTLQKEKQKNIRILYEKLHRIKNMKQNQTVSEKQREQLISLLDNEDPLYSQMVEFLSNTKSQFVKKKIQKQQEKAKAQKTKKTARFNNKN